MKVHVGRSRSVRWGSLSAVLGLVLLLLPAFQAPSVAPPGVQASREGVASISSSGARVASGTSVSPTPSISCASRTTAFAALDGPWMTRSVRAALQTAGCPIGHDEPLLNFLSNAPGSGSRVEFGVSLPAAGTGTASVLGSFWVGVSVAASRCSFDGVSYLEVQFRPPESTIGGLPSPNWTLQAPVFTLVPAGSCDPRCTNDTAPFVVLGRPFCEENAVVSGVGALRPSGWGSFAPGDQITVDFVGAVRSLTLMSVYLNDSTHPGSSVSWSYTATSTISGEGVTPYSDTASAVSAWGSGLTVVAGWWACPTVSGPTPCNSYNAAQLASVGVPKVTRAAYYDTFWSSFYAYPKVETTSSSGGCSGAPTAAPCADFTSNGGSGQYPYWSLHSAGGAAWFTLGGAYPDQVSDFGGASAQFDPAADQPLEIGTSAWDNGSVSSVVANSSSSNVTVHLHLADPAGVASVTVAGYWCFGGGSPSLQNATAQLGTGPTDTRQDGNWTATFTGVNGSGTFFALVRSLSDSGALSAPAPVSGSVNNGGVTCSFRSPSLPSFTPGGVTPVAGGYRVNWTETSAGVTNYTVWASPVPAGPERAFHVGAVFSTVLGLAASAQTFDLQLVATNVAGLSTFSSMNAPAATLPLQTASVVAPALTVLWAPNATAPLTAQVVNTTSAESPFVYRIAFGDGTTDVLGSTNTSVSTSHTYAGAYFGDAAVQLSVTDVFGDVVASPTLLLPVWATPLGVAANLSAGNGSVQVVWLPARSVGTPVTQYTVFYSTDPSTASFLTADWPSNSTAPFNGSLDNTTALTATVPAAIGAPLYVQVVAWNRYGMGALPAGDPPPVLIGVPDPLVVGPIQGALGGPAPVTDSLTSVVTGGTNTQLTQAVYSFDSVQPYPTTIAPIGDVPNAFWVNATYTFQTPGIHLIVLHAASALGDVGVATQYVFVGVGGAPLVNVTPGSGPHWVGAPVVFSARASGIGPFTYNWTFGDGTNGTGATLSHTYGTAGTFTVLAVVSDGGTGGVTAEPTSVVVDALPTVSIVTTAGPNASYSYTFTAAYAGGSGTPVVAWVFGDGFVGHGVSAHHDYAGPGTYIVNVSTTDPTGKGATSSITLLVPAEGPAAASGVLSGTSGLIVGALGVGFAVAVGAMVMLWGRERRRAAELEETLQNAGPKDAEWRDAP